MRPVKIEEYVLERGVLQFGRPVGRKTRHHASHGAAFAGGYRVLVIHGAGQIPPPFSQDDAEAAYVGVGPVDV